MTSTAAKPSLLHLLGLLTLGRILNHAIMHPPIVTGDEMTIEVDGGEKLVAVEFAHRAAIGLYRLAALADQAIL